MKQTYQQVFKEVQKELPNMKGDRQQFFYKLKQEQPERFERLTFDVNGCSPYSKDLAEIFQDFLICGIV